MLDKRLSLQWERDMAVEWQRLQRLCPSYKLGSWGSLEGRRQESSEVAAVAVQSCPDIFIRHGRHESCLETLAGTR